jgi:hypothetical protein
MNQQQATQVPLDVCVMCEVLEGTRRYWGEVSRRDNDEVLFSGAWQDTAAAAKREAREWLKQNGGAA